MADNEPVAPVPEPTPESNDIPPVTPPTPAVEPTPVAATTTTQQPAPSISPSNGLAIAAMVVGIVAVISGWIPLWGLLVSAAAIILGVLGLKRVGGKGMAITGIVTGSVGALWALFVTVFFVIAIVAGVSAAEQSREASLEKERETQSLMDAKKDFNKGETAQFGAEFEVKVNSVERNYNPGASYKPLAGKEYIVVNLTINNISDRSKYLMLSDFTVIDNGLSQRYATVPVTNELDGGNLAADGTTTGNLVFLVTSDATDLKLQYIVTIFDSNYKSKKLNYTLAL